LLQVGEKAPAWQPTLVPGQIKLKNLYDTGTSPNVLDQYDKVNLGSQDPKCTLGLNNTLRYKTSTLIFTSMAKLAAYAEPAIMMPG
jgi:hypothetical protein